MTEFYGPNGALIEGFAKPKPRDALTGEIVTAWGGPEVRFKDMRPSQMNVTMDTSKLSTADFRVMREHPQVANSLAILSFMMYQRDWHLVGGKKKSRDHATENLELLWGRIPRAMSTAIWAGYSPCALQWENDVQARRQTITKIKDLRPESAWVRWKSVDGVAAGLDGSRKTVKIKQPIFDGIIQPGFPDIPKENSFWYPLMMEEGNYYGRKLLKAAYQPWYFSMIMHLYANRYMERFAEPTPVGRAPYDDKIKIGEGAAAKEVSGNKLMGTLLGMHKNGASLVLPNSRTVDSLSGDATYDYIVEYLESQLRGVEFDRMIRMYDEEISMALFTPMLLMRTSDVGSSNLGVVQTQTWMTVLNAFANDWEEYINKYLIRPMVEQNFGPNEEVPVFKFRPLGKLDAETVRAIIQAKITAGGGWDVSAEEIGAAVGLTFEEVEQILPDPADNPLAVDDPNNPTGGTTPNNPDGSKKDPRVGRPGKNKTPTGTGKVTAKVVARIQDQATRAFSAREIDGFSPDLGFHRQLTEDLIGRGLDEFDAGSVYNSLVDVADNIPLAAFPDPQSYAQAVESALDAVMESAAA